MKAKDHLVKRKENKKKQIVTGQNDEIAENFTKENKEITSEDTNFLMKSLQKHFFFNSFNENELLNNFKIFEPIVNNHFLPHFLRENIIHGMFYCHVEINEYFLKKNYSAIYLFVVGDKFYKI